MSGSAHMAMGVFIGAMVVYVARPKVVESAVIFGITTTAILLPDIDEPRSKIGRRYPVISFIIHFLCGHRYLIHSPFLLAILSYLLNSNLQGISFVAGYGGHLLQDLFTAGGLALLYPFSRRRISLSPFRTGGITDWLMTGVLMIIIFKIVTERW